MVSLFFFPITSHDICTSRCPACNVSAARHKHLEEYSTNQRISTRDRITNIPTETYFRVQSFKIVHNSNGDASQLSYIHVLGF